MTPAEAEEAKLAFWWCYSIDKGLALSFGRSPQLLDYDIDVDLPEMESGSWGKACYIYCRAYIELGKVQSRIYTELYSVAAGRTSRDEREHATHGIVAELKAWWQRSCEVRSSISRIISIILTTTIGILSIARISDPTRFNCRDLFIAFRVLH